MKFLFAMPLALALWATGPLFAQRPIAIYRADSAVVWHLDYTRAGVCTLITRVQAIQYPSVDAVLPPTTGFFHGGGTGGEPYLEPIPDTVIYRWHPRAGWYVDTAGAPPPPPGCIVAQTDSGTWALCNVYNPNPPYNLFPHRKVLTFTNPWGQVMQEYRMYRWDTTSISAQLQADTAQERVVMNGGWFQYLGYKSVVHSSYFWERIPAPPVVPARLLRHLPYLERMVPSYATVVTVENGQHTANNYDQNSIYPGNWYWQHDSLLLGYLQPLFPQNPPIPFPWKTNLSEDSQGSGRYYSYTRITVHWDTTGTRLLGWQEWVYDSYREMEGGGGQVYHPEEVPMQSEMREYADRPLRMYANNSDLQHYEYWRVAYRPEDLPPALRRSNGPGGRRGR